MNLLDTIETPTFKAILLIAIGLFYFFLFCRMIAWAFFKGNFSQAIKNRWAKHKRKQKVKEQVKNIFVEAHADIDAFAFALATSDVESEDLIMAARMHPSMDRLSYSGCKQAAREAVLLRKDELYHLVDTKWGHEAEIELRRLRYFT